MSLFEPRMRNFIYTSISLLKILVLFVHLFIHLFVFCCWCFYSNIKRNFRISVHIELLCLVIFSYATLRRVVIIVIVRFSEEVLVTWSNFYEKISCYQIQLVWNPFISYTCSFIVCAGSSKRHRDTYLVHLAISNLGLQEVSTSLLFVYLLTNCSLNSRRLSEGKISVC